MGGVVGGASGGGSGSFKTTQMTHITAMASLVAPVVQFKQVLVQCVVRLCMPTLHKCLNDIAQRPRAFSEHAAAQEIRPRSRPRGTITRWEKTPTKSKPRSVSKRTKRRCRLSKLYKRNGDTEVEVSICSGALVQLAHRSGMNAESLETVHGRAQQSTAPIRCSSAPLSFGSTRDTPGAFRRLVSTLNANSRTRFRVNRSRGSTVFPVRATTRSR